jgi:queuine/archaeosine tRNA-ribosyltransferase
MVDNFQAVGGVIFDSGGYYVQQGAVSYETLYQRLLEFYRHNSWGEWYVLPDYVPVSGLSESEIEARVQATVTVAKLFFAEMPDKLRKYALPVVQGYTRRQIKHCIDNYADLGVKFVGFGSFDTSGDNNSINMVSTRALEMIDFLKEQVHRHGMKLHLFGIGTPEVLYRFSELEIDSFDSSCWSRTAGYGNVYLPFMGRKNISAKMIRDIGGVAYRPERFAELRDATGHKCPFCEDVERLKHNRVEQMMHNLYVLVDTVEALNQGEIIIPEQVGILPSRYENMRVEKYYSLPEDHHDAD